MKWLLSRLTVQTPVVIFFIRGDGIVFLYKDHLCYPRMDQPSALQGPAYTEKLLPSTREVSQPWGRTSGHYPSCLPAIRTLQRALGRRAAALWLNVPVLDFRKGPY